MKRLGAQMHTLRTILRATAPAILALVVVIAVGVAAAQLGGSNETIMTTRSGLGCLQNPGCPPIPATTVSVFRPATDLGVAAGALTLVALVVARMAVRRRP